MTEAPIVKNILNQNAEEYEVKEVKSLAMIGVYIAIANLGFSLIPVLTHGIFSVDLIFSVLFIVGMVGLSWQTSKYSPLAAKLLFGSMAGLFTIRFLEPVIGEEPNYIMPVMVVIVALLILGKMFPGIGAAKQLAHKNEANTAIVYGAFACIALVITLNVVGLFTIAA